MIKCKMTEVFDLLKKGYLVYRPGGTRVHNDQKSFVVTEETIKGDWSYEVPTYTFVEAMKEEQNRGIKRIKWDIGYYYREDTASYYWHIYNGNEERCCSNLKKEDILADDWIVL